MIDGREPDYVGSAPETSAGSPGSILRRCREFHGITLEEASEATKIGISHLRALEADQIREFANQAYLKGFLRIYATFLGLNSDDVARMYEKLFGVQSDKTGSGMSSAIPDRKPRRIVSLKKLVLPAFLLFAILIVAAFFKRPPAAPTPSLTSAAVVTAPRNIALQPVQSSARSLPLKPVQLQQDAEKRPAEQSEPEVARGQKRQSELSRGFVLKIKVTQNGMLTATVDGSASQQYELTSGDVIEWKAEKKVTLDLSNGGGVDVELNGKPYKSLGPSGKAVYVELDADAIKQ